MSRLNRAFACVVLVVLAATSPARAAHKPSTFSIVAYDSLTGELGVAVESKYFSVGLVVPWAEAGVGAVATQSHVLPAYGPRGLAAMREGRSPAEILQSFAAGDSAWDFRQLGMVDARGRAATWTGPKCGGWAGGEAGVAFAVQGNLLAGPAVVAEMAKAFRASRGELGERLVAAMEAGQAAGGDKRGQQSAALIVVRPSTTHPEYATRFVDLRVEDHPQAIAELRRVWTIHQGYHGAGAHMNMAAEYEAQGRADLAAHERNRVGETLRDVLARDVKNAELLNGLAWSLATHGLHLPDALRAAEKAVALEPKSADIIDTLAEIHFRMGDKAKALEVARRALALDPENKYLQAQVTRFGGK